MHTHIFSYELIIVLQSTQSLCTHQWVMHLLWLTKYCNPNAKAIQQNRLRNTKVTSALLWLRLIWNKQTTATKKQHFKISQWIIYCKCKAISELNYICTGVCDIELLCIIILSCTLGPHGSSCAVLLGMLTAKPREVCNNKLHWILPSKCFFMLYCL